MFCRVAGGDGRLTWFILHCNQMINEDHHLVENIFNNYQKWRFLIGRDEAPGHPYYYEFLAALFILCYMQHKTERRYTERPLKELY